MIRAVFIITVFAFCPDGRSLIRGHAGSGVPLHGSRALAVVTLVKGKRKGGPEAAFLAKLTP